MDIANRLGGEIVRLWVASVDFREDMAASENLMQRCADIYRKLRNTFRFLLGNLHGFDPARDRVPEAELAAPRPLHAGPHPRPDGEDPGLVRGFEFHRVYHAVNEFAIVDLSSFYLDVLKDRMYTFAPTSHERRSAQTVLWQITEALVRLVAPILSFTADEVWEYLPAVEGREASVHLALFPRPEEIFSEDPAPLLEEWKQIFAVRDEALRISSKRLARRSSIGKGLEAELEITASGELFTTCCATCRGPERDSQCLRSVTVDLTDVRDSGIVALPATGHKCARCWNFMPEVSDYGIWKNVCTRCQDGSEGNGHRPAATRGGCPVSSPFPAAFPGCCSSRRSSSSPTALTKIWVAAHIRLGGAIPVIPRVLRITHWTNEGAAFSLFAESASPHIVRWALVGFSLAAALVVLIVLVAWATASLSPPSPWRSSWAARWATSTTASSTAR